MNHHPQHAARGFVLPVILGIILVAALLAAQAATEAGSTAMLASQRLLHQRAFEAAEGGAAAAMARLESQASEPPDTGPQAVGIPGQAATVEMAQTSRIELPNGFSAGRVMQVGYEIRGTGRSARGAEVTVVQGVRQLVVAEP